MNNSHPESYYIQDGVSSANIFGAPILVDEVSSSLTYVGYAKIDRTSLTPNELLLIKKIVVAGSLTTIYHAYGVWADRASLDYVGY